MCGNLGTIAGCMDTTIISPEIHGQTRRRYEAGAHNALLISSVLQKAHQISENWNGFISAIWESAISIDYHRAESSIERAVTVCFGQITNMYGMSGIDAHSFECYFENGTRWFPVAYRRRSNNII